MECINSLSQIADINDDYYKLLNKDNSKSSVLLGCAIPTGFNSVFYSLKKINISVD